MRIGIVGSGHIGGVVGSLWAQAGHEVLFASRHPKNLESLVRRAGANASSGTPTEALAFGGVILLSIPFGALPAFAADHRDAIGTKIVLETGNPNPGRDGSMAEEVTRSGRGTGSYLRQQFPGVRIVRAFNTVWDGTLSKEANRAGPRVGIPLASDDAEALGVAARLTRDAGFDPVPVGALDKARDFDVGTSVYNTGMSGPAVRASLGLPDEEGNPDPSR